MSTFLKELQKHLTYERTATISEIVADLNEIVEIDKLSELKQKEYGKKALYYFLGLAVSIILIIIIINVASDGSYLWLVIPLLLIATIAFIIAGIYALFKLSKYKKLNFSNYRYELTKQVLQMLTRDIDNTTDIDLQLSFKAIPAKENKKDTIAHPHKSGWKIDNYQDEWLKIQGQFLDKTRFGLTAIHLSKTQYGWKRGRSGKSKYKSKAKNLGLEVILTLTYPLKRYGAVKVLQNEAMGAIQLPTFCQIRGLKITDKSINIAVRISPDMSEKNQEIYQTITMMFLSLYQILNLAKILSK
ncbi:hypothetical protein NIES4075_22850 [Tolypothrix sp. NIES-4075]|uniref:hypothetical protein n=1 Tax=Tolypothrix sp. NIES-4075 TaxID=2005459 RepID=UPI000B5C62A0|nr:hypothetical protein [Tolypothrix sp. NIES-4075]GAX41315.1 hypothetical protein NIES4075_22850 [Tolypothrix sp. NIES-4075]